MGPVAQWQEHPASIWKVPGSNPSWISDFSVDFTLSPKLISAFIPAYIKHSSYLTDNYCDLTSIIKYRNLASEYEYSGSSVILQEQ